MAIGEAQERTRNDTTEREEELQRQKYQRRWSILAILSVSLLVIIIDDTIVNVAVPTLQREFGASTTSLQWIVDAYILAFAGLLLTMGTLGDRFGRKRFLQLGLLVFAAASVFGAYSATASQLIAARALMGVGGALIMPSTLSVLIDVFPREERVKAIGIWTGVASLGIPIGPIVGGWLLEHFWWGSAFLLNVPIAAGALAAGWILIPESRNPAPPRPDLPGLALSVVALTSLVYGIIEAPSHGWTSATVLGSLGLALTSGAAFVLHEGRIREPMLDLRLFRNPRLGWGTAAIALAFLALSGLTFELTQYLQFVQRYTPLEAGLRVLPIALGFGIAGPLSQRLVPRIGTARPVAAALGGVALVLVALSLVEPETSYWLLAPALFLFGLGLGTALVPSTDAVMAAVPEANAGLGSAINDAGRQVGAAFGIGVLGALANAGYTSGIADALSPLGHSEAAAAERSVAAALQAANGLGGSAGETLRRAADAAFMDGFGLAMFAGAVLLAAGSVMVLRWLPSHDVRAGSEPATSNPDRAAYGRGFAHGAADDVSSRQHQAIAPAAADCGGVGSIKARGSETR